MHRTLATLLTFVLCANLCAQSDPSAAIKQQILAQSANTKLEIKMNDGKKLTGELVSAGESSFILAAGPKDAPVSQTILYANVSKVAAKRRTHTPLIAWIAVGAVVAAVVIVVAAFGIEKHNE